GNVLDRDFGFQVPPASQHAISGIVWNDTSSNGVKDGSEVGIASVTVNLLNAAGTTVLATTSTDANGAYSFPGLASANYLVRITDTLGILSGYDPTYEKTEHLVPPFNGQEAVTLGGSDITDVNFGYKKPTPTYASVDSLVAFVSHRTVFVQWRTSSELGTIGFDLLRYDPATGSFVKLNGGLLPGLVVHPQGGVYRFRDDDAPLQGSLTYRLVEVDLQDTRREHGPFTVTVGDAAPESEREGAQQALWTDEPYQRRPNQITPEQQARLQAGAVEQMDAVEAAIPVLGGGTAKIATTGGGLTYVSASQIGSALGVTSNAAVALIAKGGVDLTSLGAELAYLPASGNTGLYFYANQPQTIYSAQSAYLLTSGHGTTIGSAPRGASGPPARSFAATLHLEENHIAATALFSDPDGDFWLWDYVFVYPGYATDSKSFTVPVTGVAGTGTASLKIHLLGGNDDANSSSDHVAVVYWNGTLLSPAAQWDGTNPFDLIVPIDPASIHEGTNTLTLEGDLGSGVAYSLIYLDYIELTYQRQYRASNDTLTFSAPTASAVSITGFSSSDILVLDLGTSGGQGSALPAQSTPQPTAVSPVITPSGDGTYQAAFVTATGRIPHSYLAAVRAQAKTPVAVTAMTVAGLKNQSNRADYLLIAPDALVSATNALAAYRSSQGLQTKVVALKDIYNEFNAGNASPYAIQAFLNYAVSKWQRSPRYATLVGRGTYDYQNVSGHGDCLVPPLLTATPNGLFVSDNRIADFSKGDGVPDIALGRLPVLTSLDVANYLAKIEAREQAAVPSQILMVADNPDQAGSFNVESDTVAAIVPTSPYTITTVYLGQPPAQPLTAAAGEQAIINAINGGVMIFNYIGHGGPGQLADENLFQVSDIASLTNAGAMPIFLGMTCASGNFGFPGIPSLAEDMLLKQGGGVYASWASTGLSQDDQSVLLNKAFYTATFVRGTTRVGDIIVSSMQSHSVTSIPASMKDLYNLLGEPVSKLR
ncbi:MAG TPA: C25 family cysteine peptidase, partial [Mycobacterium sp.]|nr:C25 family cysteine peptidase [Mycobacterium sp.]